MENNTDSAVATEISLSPRAQQVGGALARIMVPGVVEKYAHEGVLERLESRAIGDLVADNPELNTDNRVGMLVWLFSFHGMSKGDLGELFEGYSPEHVCLVIDYLYEIGERAQKASNDEPVNPATIGLVEGLLDFLLVVENHDLELLPKTVEAFDSLIESVGDLSVASSIDTAESLIEALPVND